MSWVQGQTIRPRLAHRATAEKAGELSEAARLSFRLPGAARCAVVVCPCTHDILTYTTFAGTKKSATGKPRDAF